MKVKMFVAAQMIIYSELHDARLRVGGKDMTVTIATNARAFSSPKVSTLPPRVKAKKSGFPLEYKGRPSKSPFYKRSRLSSQLHLSNI